MDILNFTGLGLPAALLCLPVFAACDRLWGAGKPAFKGKKAVILLASLLMGGLAGGLFGLCLGAAFFADRSIPFFKSSAAPHNASELLACVFRNALIVPIAAFAAQQMGQDVTRITYYYVAYATASVTLAIVYGRLDKDAKRRGEDIGDANTLVELLRGAAQGLAVAASIGGM